MRSSREAEVAESLFFGYSPRAILASVGVIATVVVLWPLGGLQIFLDAFQVPRQTTLPTRQFLDSGSLPEMHVSAQEDVQSAQTKELMSISRQVREQLGSAEAEAKELREELLRLKARQVPDGLPRPPLAIGETLADRRPAVPRIGGSIAVHGPKFSFVGRFLEQWYGCEPARRSMDMYIVLWGDKDADLFKRGMAKNHPSVPPNAWTAVVGEVPGFASVPGGVSNQIIGAWKKWYGITYMMDLDNPPVYGLMLDAELLLYNTSDCGTNSEWYRMFDRVQALESAKLWPAAQVNDFASYDFGEFKQSGKDYDRLILEDNARFIGAHPDQDQCKDQNTPGCREVKRQIDLVLFSWWTDVPYVALKVAERMLPSIAQQKPEQIVNEERLGKWCKLAHHLLFPRFEHISYQQWCCLNEGYHWDDVTAVTGNAVWGSYLEDPKPQNGYGSSRLAELHPMWLPADANKAIKEGKVPPMSHIDPPLMHLHVDHFADDYDIWPSANAWNDFFKEEGSDYKGP